MRYATFLLALFVLQGVALPATLHVPGEYPTIQEAILAAGMDDTVLVAPGTYEENIDFLGKAITVKSSAGPEATIIDGNQNGVVAAFSNMEDLDSVLSGFTITNGTGGVLCFISSPKITNNIITENSHSNGAGIFCMLASPLIANNIITGNTAAVDGGGILCIEGSNPHITNNLLSENSAGGNGGAIWCFYHCLPAITNNILFGNWAAEGGGIYSGYLTGTMITNNTLYGNSASMKAGGIYCYNEYISVTNNILWENTAPNAPQIYSESGDATVTYSNIQGGYPGTGNINETPLFVDPSHLDFHLYFDSPCKDSGSNSAPALPEDDFEGDPRQAFDAADMGADEFHNHLYCTGHAAPGGNVEIKIADIPLAGPIVLWVGTGVLEEPIPTNHGAWFLELPILLFYTLGSIPEPQGIYTIPITLPPGMPPLEIPIQATVEYKLTNLCIISVKKSHSSEKPQNPPLLP
jgi:hypothetical protein